MDQVLSELSTMTHPSWVAHSFIELDKAVVHVISFPEHIPDAALSPRVQAPVPPTRKPTQASGPTLPTRRQTTEARGTTTLQLGERIP